MADERLCDALQQYEKKKETSTGNDCIFIYPLQKAAWDLWTTKGTSNDDDDNSNNNDKTGKTRTVLVYIASIVHRRVLIIRYLFITNFLRLQFNKSSRQVALTACSNGSVFITKVAFPWGTSCLKTSLKLWDICWQNQDIQHQQETIHVHIV